MEVITTKNFFKRISKLRAGLTSADLRSALRFAIKPVKSKAQSLAPKGSRMHRTHKGRMVAPGFMSRSLKVNTFSYNGGAGASVRFKPEAFYAGFVGSGYRAHGGSKKGGGVTFSGKKVAGRPILKPAVDQNRGALPTRFMQQLIKRLQKKGAI